MKTRGKTGANSATGTLAPTKCHGRLTGKNGGAGVLFTEPKTITMPSWFPIRIRPAVAALFLLALAGCLLKDDRSAGRGSEVENELAGVFIDEGGGPAAGAAVKAYDPDAFSLAKAGARARALAVDSVFTDARGAYVLKGLPAGRYNVIGDFGGGKLVALIAGVDHGDTLHRLDLGVRTLRPPGWIEGRVTQGGAGKGSVFAYLPGTSYMAISDGQGAFLVSGVPEGRYRVSYLVPGSGAAPDTGVVVVSGDTTRLAPKELGYDTALPPPEPTGLRAGYDTLAQAVRLDWDATRVSDLLGYLVYRDSGAGDAPELLTNQALLDTLFTDTLPDSLAGSLRQVTYRVRSIDRNKNPSVNYSAPLSVAVAPAALVTTSLHLTIEGARAGQAGIGDTVRLALAYANPGRDIRRVEWLVGDSVSPVRARTDTTRNGKDTLAVSWADPGRRAIRIRAVDASGREAILDTALEVLLDPPRAEAGRDTAVAAGNTVRLRGKGSDGFGVIVRWEWDVGGAGFAPADSGRRDFRSPTTPVDRLPCILRVTDDDGLQALDTLFVRVAGLTPPVAAVSTPFPEVFTGDTVRLSSLGSVDSLGRIVKREWDIGAKGSFAASPGADTSFVAGAPDSAFPCLLRVTDNDGQSDTARLVVAVRPRDRYLRLPTAGLLDSLLYVHAWVLDGRLWVAGVALGDGLPRFLSTGDLAVWKREASDYPGDSWGAYGVNPAFQVAGGKVWVVREPFGADPDAPAREVWASRDGAAWVSLGTPPVLQAKFFNASAGLGKDIYLFNGFDMHLNKPFPGIWRTSDGIDFTQVPGTPAFGSLNVVFACSHAGKLWVYGIQRDGKPASEVWSSADGALWVRAAAPALPVQFDLKAMFDHGGKLWMYGNTLTTLSTPQAWSSSDGSAWTQSAIPLPAREDGQFGTVLGFQNRTIELLEYFDADDVHRGEVWIAP
jgi:hypothetical protein